MCEICIVTSADDKFAVGLAGTIQSVLHHLSPRYCLRLFVLDGGISPANKRRLERFWNDPRLRVLWIPVDRSLVSRFPVSEHISDAAYYRLLSPEILAENVDKFIYLDADMLVQRDIGVLWEEPLQDAPCLAVQDSGAPYFDSVVALADQEYACKHLVCVNPVANYAELGLPAQSRYFNSGLLVIDLAKWRNEKLAEKMLHVLDEHREHVKYWDQYALNVVLCGRWRQLDPRWNQNSYIHRLPGWQETIFSQSEYQRYLSDPWIVHFNWIKPWQPKCTHPMAEAFRAYLKGSPWEPPPLRLPVAEVPRKPSIINNAHEYVRLRVRRIRHKIYAILGRRAA